MLSILSLVLAAANAQVFAPFPAVVRPALAPALGAAPAETRIAMLASLDLTRITHIIAPLGDKDYKVSIAPMRGGSPKSQAPILDAELVGGDAWVVTLVPAGANRHELAASWPFPALRKQPLEADLGAAAYIVSLVDGIDLAVRFQAKNRPLGGLQLPVSVLKRAVWEGAAPIPAMGPEWRFAFNVDLWIGAGMRSFVFMRRNDDGSVEFYRTGAEAVDSERPLLRRVGPMTVALQLDENASLIITPR